MTIQEKYKYLYDNYRKDCDGYFGGIIGKFYLKGIITSKERKIISTLYERDISLALHFKNYLTINYSNSYILIINLLYNKCKNL